MVSMSTGCADDDYDDGGPVVNDEQQDGTSDGGGGSTTDDGGGTNGGGDGDEDGGDTGGGGAATDGGDEDGADVGDEPPSTRVVKMTIRFEGGNYIVRVELDMEAAPVTCENFIGYVEDEFYDDTKFHRVIEDFVVQGGGFDSDGTKKATKDPIPLERTGLSNVLKTIAMARTSDPDSATSQFYFNVADNSASLDPGGATGPDGYTVFGEVIEGWNIINEISKTQTDSGDEPTNKVLLVKARMEADGR